MAAKATDKKFAALGLNAPGEGHDADAAYTETVRNLIRQGDQERLEKVSTADLEAANALIQAEDSGDQHVLTVGGES